MTTDNSTGPTGASSADQEPRQPENDWWGTGAANSAGTSSSRSDASSELVRHLDFDTAQPIKVDVRNGLGPVRVELTDTTRTHVEVRHDAGTGNSDWRSGLTGLLNWVTEQFGEGPPWTGPDAERDRAHESVTDAVRRTQIDMTGNRLTVDTPNTAPLRNIPLAVRVQVPARSDVTVHNSAGEVIVHGAAGGVQVQAGSGTVSLSEAAEHTTIRTGSGDLRLGNVAGGVHARSGSGNVEIANLTGASSVVTGSADVSLGEIRGDVLVRSGSGDVSVGAAVSGEIELITGSGELHIAIHRGCAAEVDLTSSSGNARSELDVSENPPENTPELRVFGRSGTGDAVLTSAG